MKFMMRLLILFLLVIVALPPGRSAYTGSDQGFTARVSLRSDGTEANDNSRLPDISADGRYLTFASNASNLVSNDSNDARDIFVHDRQTGITQRVSVNSDGEQGNFDSDAPAISDDGRFITFYSFATNLQDNDTNGVADIFLHDRQTGQTSVVNRVIGGQANDISYDPDISGDGHYITFWSFARNLVGKDNNLRADVFRYDRIGQTMLRVSVDSNGVEANGNSQVPHISANGRYLTFESDANNLVSGDGLGYRDVFWHDVVTGETRRVSVSSGGAEVNGDSYEAAISADGRYVSFTSFASDLTPDDDNPFRDVFRHDTQNGDTERISRVIGSLNTWEQPSLSGNGRFLAARGRSPAACDDTLCEIYLFDVQTDTAVRVSISSGGVGANDDSVDPVLASNGRYLTFASDAHNLVPNDGNGKRDIFIHDYLPPPSLTINHSSGAPGSIFALTGSNFPFNGTADVRVNGTTLGQVTADGNGTLTFRLSSQPTTDEGAYFVTLQSGSFIAKAHFTLNVTAPIHPPAGSGPTFALPNGIAFTHFQYLPLVAKP
jgi:Tol biopolymer transport system component